MKLLPLLAAATVAMFAIPAASAAPAPAAAPMASAAVGKAEIQRDRHHRRATWRRTCTTKWRHHRKVRVCRRVRVWR
jgi:hypothetical protein